MSNCTKNILNKKESIPVESVPPAWKLYVVQFHWPPPDVTLGCHSRGPQINNFAGVSSDHHQILLEWGGQGWEGPRSDDREAGVRRPCTVRSYASWVMVT